MGKKGKGRASKAAAGSPAVVQSASAPQATPHNRGGTHRVKDEDKTNTRFDDMNRQELEDLTKLYKIYVKDTKKADMAKKLAYFEKAQENERRRAQQEQDNVKKQTEEAANKEKTRRKMLQKSLLRRNADRAKRRANGDQDVSADEIDDFEVEEQRGRDAEQEADTKNRTEEDFEKDFEQKFNRGDGKVGEILTDTCTESESSTRSDTPPTWSSNRIRLFEWTARNGQGLASAESTESDEDEDKVQQSVTHKGVTRPIPYAPFRVLTTQNKTKQFPNLKYKAGIVQDSAPILSADDRFAARNGILKGDLSKAVIEKATDWAQQTQIDGTTGCVFFKPIPASARPPYPLRDVYRSYNDANRRLLQVKRDLVDDIKLRKERAKDHERRHSKRQKNRAVMTKEVYEACRYRPHAICYLPAYMSYSKAPLRMRGDLEHRTLENLYYVRFPDCDVPHYYFWTHKGHWHDPTVPNPKWLPMDTTNSQKSAKKLVRIKATGVAPDQGSHPQAQQKNGNILERARRFERDLYVFGLKSVLNGIREKCKREGKSEDWELLMRSLRKLYPGRDKLPTVPPVHAMGTYSIAFKLASLDILGGKSPLYHINALDPWTSRDDEFWPLKEIEVEEETGSPTDTIDKQSHKVDTHTEGVVNVQALYRRRSSAMTEACAAWLEKIDVDSPHMEVDLLPSSPVQTESGVRIEGKQHEESLHIFQTDMDLICPFCTKDLSNMSLQMQAEHAHAHTPLLPTPTKQFFASFNSQQTLARSSRRASNDTAPVASVTGEGPKIQVTGSNTHTMVVRRSTRVSRRRSSVRTHEQLASASAHAVSPKILRTKRDFTLNKGAISTSSKRRRSDIESDDVSPRTTKRRQYNK